MLKVLAIQSKDEQKRICSLCSIPYDAVALSYAVYDDDEILGASQFRLKGTKCYITDIKNKDGVDNCDSLFIMGRGLLNFVDLVGIHDAYISSDDLPKINIALAEKIGFTRSNSGEYYMNLRGFFEAKH